MQLTVFRPEPALAQVWLPALFRSIRAMQRALVDSRSARSAVAREDAFLAYSALDARVRYQTAVITDRGGLLHIGSPVFLGGRGFVNVGVLV